MKKYLVQVTLKAGYVTHYFSQLGGHAGAATFFYRYCKKMGINKPQCLSHATPHARESGDGVIVDFERIADIQLSSIFELQ